MLSGNKNCSTPYIAFGQTPPHLIHTPIHCLFYICNSFFIPLGGCNNSGCQLKRSTKITFRSFRKTFLVHRQNKRK